MTAICDVDAVADESSYISLTALPTNNTNASFVFCFLAAINSI